MEDISLLLSSYYCSQHRSRGVVWNIFFIFSNHRAASEELQAERKPIAALRAGFYQPCTSDWYHLKRFNEHRLLQYSTWSIPGSSGIPRFLGMGSFSRMLVHITFRGQWGGQNHELNPTLHVTVVGSCKQSGDTTWNPIFSDTEEGDRAVGFAGKIQLIEQQRVSRSSFLGLSVCPSGLTKPGAEPKSQLCPVRIQNWKREKSFPRNDWFSRGAAAFPALDAAYRTGMGSRAHRKHQNHKRNSNFFSQISLSDFNLGDSN